MAHQVKVRLGPRMTAERDISSAVGVQSGVALRKQYNSIIAGVVPVVPVSEDTLDPRTPLSGFRGAVENDAGMSHPFCVVHGQDLFQLYWL